MKERDDRIEKLKARLEEWSAELDGIEAEAREAGEEAGTRFQDRVRELKTKAQQAQEAISRLKNSNEDSWQELRGGAENLWGAFRKNFTKVKTEFKRGYKEGMKD